MWRNLGILPVIFYTGSVLLLSFGSVHMPKQHGLFEIFIFISLCVCLLMNLLIIRCTDVLSRRSAKWPEKTTLVGEAARRSQTGKAGDVLLCVPRGVQEFTPGQVSAMWNKVKPTVLRVPSLWQCQIRFGGRKEIASDSDSRSEDSDILRDFRRVSTCIL